VNIQYTDDLIVWLEKRFSRPRDGVKRFYGVQTVVGLTRSEAQEKYERIQQCIPPEGAMAWISGHFGPDFAKYDPELFRISLIYAEGMGCRVW